jgi:hypothetical protein
VIRTTQTIGMVEHGSPFAEAEWLTIVRDLLG